MTVGYLLQYVSIITVFCYHHHNLFHPNIQYIYAVCLWWTTASHRYTWFI